MIQQKATGIPIIKRALANNGSPEAEFKTDEDRSYFQYIRIFVSLLAFVKDNLICHL